MNFHLVPMIVILTSIIQNGLAETHPFPLSRPEMKILEGPIYGKLNFPGQEDSFFIENVFSTSKCQLIQTIENKSAKSKWARDLDLTAPLTIKTSDPFVHPQAGVSIGPIAVEIIFPVRTALPLQVAFSSKKSRNRFFSALNRLHRYCQKEKTNNPRFLEEDSFPNRFSTLKQTIQNINESLKVVQNTPTRPECVECSTHKGPTYPLQAEYQGEDNKSIGPRGPVHYLNEVEREKLRVIVKNGRLVRASTGELVTEFGLFVMNPQGRLYVSKRRESLAQNETEVDAHSAFLGGLPVLSAGMIDIQEGKILGVNNMSGHYKPPIVSLAEMLRSLQSEGYSNVDQVRIDSVSPSEQDRVRLVQELDSLDAMKQPGSELNRLKKAENYLRELKKGERLADKQKQRNESK